MLKLLTFNFKYQKIDKGKEIKNDIHNTKSVLNKLYNVINYKIA